MKKYLVIIIAAALFTGCLKKNDTTTAPPPSYILGKWNITADTGRVSVNGTTTSTVVLKQSVNPYVQFNSDNSGVIMRDTTGAGATLKFTYNVNNGVLMYSYPSQTYNGSVVPAYITYATINTVKSGGFQLVSGGTAIVNGVTETDYEVMYINK